MGGRVGQPASGDRIDAAWFWPKGDPEDEV
jgi:hypothetical protein